jgi:DNA-binding helix-hairpin-helix protein with protein kinase domain
VRIWQDTQERKRQAFSIHQEIRGIETKRALAKKQAHDHARQTQLDDYLDQFFIRRETWQRIPKSTLSALTSYGIETAADVTRDEVLKVPGFGAVRTQMLIDWRDRKAKGFRFDPSKTAHDHQQQQLDRKLLTDRRQQERSLIRVKSQIDALVTSLTTRKGQHDREFAEAAQKLAQSLADGEALRLPWARQVPAKPAQPPPQPNLQFSSSPAQPPPTYKPWYGKPKRKRRSKGWRRRP